MASALSTVTGISRVRGFARRLLQHLLARISGRCRSSRIQSGVWIFARSSPSCPCMARNQPHAVGNAPRSVRSGADSRGCLRCTGPFRARESEASRAISTRPDPVHSVAGSSRSSSSIENLLPRPTALSTPMVPPIASTSRLDKRQAQSGSADFGLIRVQPFKWCEDSLQPLWRNSGARCRRFRFAAGFRSSLRRTTPRSRRGGCT